MTPLPLNVSREMIQDSPILTAIRKGVTSHVLGDLEKLAEKEPESYAKIWENFGAMLKEGIYDDFERRDALLAFSQRVWNTGSTMALWPSSFFSSGLRSSAKRSKRSLVREKPLCRQSPQSVASSFPP